jgi:hypothetical protein
MLIFSNFLVESPKFSRSVMEVCPIINLEKYSIDEGIELKKTPVVIGQLLWQPFEARFSNFLKKLEFHDKVLDSEVLILQSQSTQAILTDHRDSQKQLEALSQKMETYFNLLNEIKQTWSSGQKGKFLTSNQLARISLNSARLPDLSYPKMAGGSILCRRL